MLTRHVNFGLVLALSLGSIGLAVVTSASGYIIDEVGAWHIHTFFLEYKPSQVDEALNLRRALRAMINAGLLQECSINQINLGPSFAYPTSMYEMCCNATSFNAAYSFMAQNHGNLSVFIHPLTRQDAIDHTQRGAWMGQPVIMDMECPCWFPLLPEPKPCPIYPEYSDELPKKPTASCHGDRGWGKSQDYI